MSIVAIKVLPEPVPRNIMELSCLAFSSNSTYNISVFINSKLGALFKAQCKSRLLMYPIDITWYARGVFPC